MISGELIREARLRAGLTQADLGNRVAKPQSVIARWERGEVQPSLETLRRIVRGCGFDLSFHLSKTDDETMAVIDQHLRMNPSERFADLLKRVRFHDRLEDRRQATHG